MTRQAEHQAKRRAEGHRKRQFVLTPATVAALAQIRERGAKSDAAAVNAAVAFTASNPGLFKLWSNAHEEATRG